jgi:hypothetical protein
MSRDVELFRQRMLEAQVALLTCSRRNDYKTKNHQQLIEELHKATKDFLDSVDRLTQNPPSRLVSD